MKKAAALFLILIGISSHAQSYPPEAGLAGSTAIFKESADFKAWATGIEVVRGYLKKSDPNFSIGGNNKASAGEPSDALGFPDGNTVSLGDEGNATVTFASPIIDGDGFDFAVFENGGPTYLELAFVEASSDGLHFFRFPAHSQTQTAMQIGPFGTPSATYLNNLAGKYSAQYGTPFDLSGLPDADFLDKNNITHIRIIDVVGSVDPEFATFDSFGNAVNESFPTPFASCGFDLQAVGVIHQRNLGLNDNLLKSISVYPNPAIDYICVNSEKQLKAALFDNQGRIVIEKYVDKNQKIPVSQLKSGIYFLQLASDDPEAPVTIHKKIIIK